VESLGISRWPLYKPRSKVCNAKPGWKDHVEELHEEARNAFKDGLGQVKAGRAPRLKIRNAL